MVWDDQSEKLWKEIERKRDELRRAEAEFRRKRKKHEEEVHNECLAALRKEVKENLPSGLEISGDSKNGYLRKVVSSRDLEEWRVFVELRLSTNRIAKISYSGKPAHLAITLFRDPLDYYSLDNYFDSGGVRSISERVIPKTELETALRKWQAEGEEEKRLFERRRERRRIEAQLERERKERSWIRKIKKVFRREE